METDWMNHAIGFMSGMLIGLLLGRVIRAVIALVALSGVVAAALVVLGHVDALKQGVDVLPDALAMCARVAAVSKEVLVGTPAALLGSLSGVLLLQIVRLVKS